MNPNRRKVFGLVGAAALSGLVGCGGGGNKSEVAQLKIANNSLYSFDKVDLTANTDFVAANKFFFVDPANNYEQPIEKIAGSNKNIFVLPPVINQVRGKIRVKNADKVTHEGDITVTPIPVISQPGQLAKDYSRATLEINRQGLIAAQKANDVKAVDTIIKLNEFITENLKLIDAVMVSGTTLIATSASGNKLQMSIDDLKRMDQFVAKMSYEIGLKNVKINTTPQPQNAVAPVNPPAATNPIVNPPTTVNPTPTTPTAPTTQVGFLSFNGNYYTSDFLSVVDPVTGRLVPNPDPAGTRQAYNAFFNIKTLASTPVVNENTTKADAPFLAGAIPESAITNFDGSKAAPGTSDKEYSQMVSVLTTFEQAANVVNASAVVSGVLVTAAVAGLVVFAAPATAAAAIATAGVIADVWVGTVIGVNAASIVAKYLYDKPAGFSINDESKAIFDAGVGKIAGGKLDQLGDSLGKITATHVFTPNSYGAAASRASGELVKAEIGEQLGKGSEDIFKIPNTSSTSTTTPTTTPNTTPTTSSGGDGRCPPGQAFIQFIETSFCSSNLIQ